MPELLLHFSIPFSLVAPVLGIKRALLAGFIAILPDIDALMYVHRSLTHSIPLLTIPVILLMLVSWKAGKGLRTIAACSLSLLSHPILDLFQSPTPVLYPLSQYSYHLSVKMNTLISEKIIPEVSVRVNFETTNFSRFQTFDAPIFTDVGFIISLILVVFPSIHRVAKTLRHTGLYREPGPYSEQLGKTTDVGDAGILRHGHGNPGLSFSKDDVTIMIPTLNEEEAIGRVIGEVREAGYRNIIVVDGYSSDRTVEIARSMGARVVNQVGHGKSSAIKTGIEMAQTPYILVMDGDGTYDSRDIDRMLETAVEKNCDEVVGYRVDRENIPLLHRLGNRVISTLISLLMGQRVKDPCSGIYLLRSDLAKRLEITATGFDVEAEIVSQSIVYGRVVEVPVRYRRRIGNPKLSTWGAGIRIALTALKIAWLYNPVLLFSLLGSAAGVGGLAILLWQLYMRYILGERAWSIGWAWLGLVLLIVGVQSFTVAVISLMLKRLERRVVQNLRSERGEV
jgi:glycosyltransferase involved in cell wall biosynthesis